MRLLLDTHAFIDLSNENLTFLKRGSAAVLADEDVDLLLSSVSITEIVIKAAVGKLSFSQEDLVAGIEQLRVTRIGYEPKHALRLFSLPLLADHRDPFDRMLIATALEEDVSIVTADRQFRRYKGVKLFR